MTATVVNVTESSVGSGTSITVNMPASPVAGNLLRMFVGFWGGGTPACTGWTLDSVTGGTSARMAVFSRVATGSESSTYPVTGFTDDDTRAAVVVQVSGHNGVDITSTPTALIEDTSVWTVPSDTTTANDCLVLTFFYTQSNSGTPTFAWSTGTQISNFASASGTWKSYETGISRVQAVAGSTTAVTVTRTAPDSSANAAVATVAVKPAVIPNTGKFFAFF